jgi:hypothetical protein
VGLRVRRWGVPFPESARELPLNSDDCESVRLELCGRRTVQAQLLALPD